MTEMFTGRPIMPDRKEQLHRIFELCGSPSDDYWKKKKMKHPTSFRPPEPYKPSTLEAFRDFASSLGLMFFITSPLAFDLSGLPVIYKPEEETPYTTSKLSISS